VKVQVRELCEEGLLHVLIDDIEQVVDFVLAGEVFVTRCQDAG
jgi:hypothetical protein